MTHHNNSFLYHSISVSQHFPNIYLPSKLNFKLFLEPRFWFGSRFSQFKINIIWRCFKSNLLNCNIVDLEEENIFFTFFLYMFMLTLNPSRGPTIGPGPGFYQLRIFIICTNLVVYFGIKEEWFCKTRILFSMFHNYVPFKRGFNFILTIWNFLSIRIFCTKIGLIWASGSREIVKTVKSLETDGQTDRQMDIRDQKISLKPSVPLVLRNTMKMFDVIKSASFNFISTVVSGKLFVNR